MKQPDVVAYYQAFCEDTDPLYRSLRTMQSDPDRYEDSLMPKCAAIPRNVKNRHKTDLTTNGVWSLATLKFYKHGVTIVKEQQELQENTPKNLHTQTWCQECEEITERTTGFSIWLQSGTNPGMFKLSKCSKNRWFVFR